MSRRLYQLSYRPESFRIAGSGRAGQGGLGGSGGRRARLRGVPLHGVAGFQQGDLFVHGFFQRRGQAHDFHIEETAHNGGGRFILV